MLKEPNNREMIARVFTELSKGMEGVSNLNDIVDSKKQAQATLKTSGIDTSNSFNEPMEIDELNTHIDNSTKVSIEDSLEVKTNEINLKKTKKKKATSKGTKTINNHELIYDDKKSSSKVKKKKPKK